MARFYSQTLGVRTERSVDGSLLTIWIGPSVLEVVWSASEVDPYYHFAFTIPENKFELARAWLASRVPLLLDSETGRDTVHFPSINADSIYFLDPSGNIVEFIARHTLLSQREGPFSSADLLCISEIVLASTDGPRLFARLRENLAMEPWYESSAFLGDDDGTLIVFPTGKLLLPERRMPTKIFQTRVDIQGHGDRRFDGGDLQLPYEIKGVS